VGVLLAAGVVSGRDVVAASEALWRPSLTIVSIMLTTDVARRFGILSHFARRLEPQAGQSVGHVFASVFAFSAATSATLNNDAAVLLLTPLVITLVRRSYPNRPDLLVPFAFAVFSAAGVAPLVISNPMNLVVAEYAGIGFNAYAARMIPVALVGWLVAYLVLKVLFSGELRAASASGAALLDDDVGLPARSKQFLALMIISLGAYPALSYVGGPVWVISTLSAILALLLCWRHRMATPARLAAGLSWDILVFLFCVFVIVYGLRNVGLVGRISTLYQSVSDGAGQVIVVGLSSALGSAVLNNHPMAILNALAIRELPGQTQRHVLAALIGGDLGPRLLPIGSLAGLLWVDILRRLGVHVALSRFILVGVSLTVPTLALSLAVLLLLS
jgi:arsenical pump membrane protein